jgi:hypothetical protein
MSLSTDAIDTSDSLKQEGEQIARYLTGVLPPPDVLERYVEAHALLFRDAVSPTERASILFVRHHAWALPYMDAGLAVLRPHSRLRNKILLMFALLETTPDFIDLFFAESLSRTGALFRMIKTAAKAVLHVILGVALYPFMVRSR